MNVFDYLFENTKILSKHFVLNKENSLSYQSLYSNSLVFANSIKQRLGQGKNIIILSQNSTFFITAYLGILKSNNICVPLSYDIEQENLDYIVKLVEAPLVCISKKYVNKYQILDDIEVLILEDFLPNELDQQCNEGITRLSIDSNTLASIIFTSGSTGKPKGVMLSHKNIITNTNDIINYLKLTRNDKVLVVLPFYYCYGLSLLHTHMRVGGSVVLNNTFTFIGTVISNLKEYGCTGFSGVPSHFQILLRKSKSFKTTDFPFLRYVTQAGGKLFDVFIIEFIKAFPNIDFFTMYGQTEATARLSYLEPNMLKKKLGSIGRGLLSVDLDIVDKNGQTLPPERMGELIAKGDNVMLGYFKDQVLTETTIKNKWLHTGDLAKKDKEGYIYLQSRKTEFVKIRGKKVYTKEIENLISESPHVINCKVVGYQDNLMGEALKAEIQLVNLKMKDTVKEDIIRLCKKRLSDYKIPQQFEFMKQIGLKSSGK